MFSLFSYSTNLYLTITSIFENPIWLPFGIQNTAISMPYSYKEKFFFPHPNIGNVYGGVCRLVIGLICI